MNDTDRQKRNEEKLTELHPWMRQRVIGLLVDLEHHGWKPRIQDAWRSPEDQLKAFNSGHSKLKYGYHNVTGPGGVKESFACDILREDDSVLKAEKEYCIALAHYAKKQGLATGIVWGMPQAIALATMRAVAQLDLNANVKISWDPTHCEPSDPWLAKLQGGWRPESNTAALPLADNTPAIVPHATLQGYCDELTTIAAKAADLRNRMQGHLK